MAKERLDYDTDPIKHFVRYDGWLEACRTRYEDVQRAIRRGRRRRPFSYFTFCASNAIDVFMLERERYIVRDEETGRLENVFFCEKDEGEFEKIISLVRSREAGFKGDFKQIVLFEDDEDTNNKTSIDEYARIPDKGIREKFFYKHLHTRFRNIFPLDVINLDIHGVFFPKHEQTHSEMLRAVERIFDLQRNRHQVDSHQCERFSLMLTTHLEEEFYRPEALNELKQVSLENLQRHEEYATEFNDKFGINDPYALTHAAFPAFFSITLPKVIAPIARRYGWFGNHRKIYTYSRALREGRPDYHMMSTVTNYERLPDEVARLPRLWEEPTDDFTDRYITEMCNIVRHKPVNVDERLTNDAEVRQVVIANLQDIVNFREEFIASTM